MGEAGWGAWCSGIGEEGWPGSFGLPGGARGQGRAGQEGYRVERIARERGARQQLVSGRRRGATASERSARQDARRDDLGRQASEASGRRRLADLGLERLVATEKDLREGNVVVSVGEGAGRIGQAREQAGAPWTSSCRRQRRGRGRRWCAWWASGLCVWVGAGGLGRSRGRWVCVGRAGKGGEALGEGGGREERPPALLCPPPLPPSRLYASTKFRPRCYPLARVHVGGSPPTTSA